MANVIKTVYTYPLDGTTTDFQIPFEYLARKFVVVTLVGQDRKELTVVTDYRFATRTTISLTRAWGPADNYQQIELRRYTSATERLVDFSDGSILRAMDLNVAQVQTLHVAEEARDLTADTIGVNNDGNLDARGRRIVNVADGVDPGDVVTVGQMNRWSGSAADSANKAKTSETNAKTSETNSKTSETNAKTSETNSKASETLAQKWASNPLNVIVADAKYSSMHYSLKAADYANAALGYRDAAGNSANAASDSEDAAATSAASAKTESDKLIEFNTLVDRINGVAVRQVGEFEVHNSRTYAKPGTVYGDGQLLNRNQFPALVAELLAGRLPVVSDAVWLADPGKRGCYTLGNGTTTFRVPDLNGVYAGSIKAPVFRGDAGFTIGDVQKTALPNIEGLISQVDNEISASASGAFYKAGGSNKGATNDTSGGQLGFDASLWNDVYKKDINEARMNGIVIVWVIRTHGVINNPGSVDAAVLASRVEQVYTELTNRTLSLENRVKLSQYTPRTLYEGSFGVSQGEIDLGENIINRHLRLHFIPGTGLKSVVGIILPEPGIRIYTQMGSWSQQYDAPSETSIRMLQSSTAGPVQKVEVLELL